MERLKLYTGLSEEELNNDLSQKVKILKWLVKKNIENVTSNRYDYVEILYGN